MIAPEAAQDNWPPTDSESIRGVPSRAAAIVAAAPMRLRPAADLLAAPSPIDWLVHGWIESGSFAMVNGAPASGKSFVALSIAASVAAESLWYGRVVKYGPVIYLCGEGHRGIARRLRAWSDHFGVALDTAPLFISDRAVPLNQPVDAYEVGQEIERAVDRCGMVPRLIVVDTLARHFNGDESSAQEAGGLIAQVVDLGQRWRAAMLLVHHSGHGNLDRGRGSSAFRAACDAEFLVKRDGHRVEMRCMKSKDADEPEPLAFDLVGVSLPWTNDDGTPTTSAVLRFAGVSAPSENLPAKAPSGANQKKALDILCQMQTDHGRTLESSGYDPAQARVTCEAWRERCGLSRQRFHEVFESLVNRGAVIHEPPHVRSGLE